MNSDNAELNRVREIIEEAQEVNKQILEILSDDSFGTFIQTAEDQDLSVKVDNLQTDLKDNPRAQLMLMKLKAVLTKMDTAADDSDPIALCKEVDKELEELKDIPEQTDEEIDEILKGLFEKNRDLNCLINEDTGRLPPSNKCLHISQQIKGWWRAKKSNLDPSEVENILSVITQAEEVSQDLRKVISYG